MPRFLRNHFILLLCLVILTSLRPLAPVQAQAPANFADVDAIVTKLMDMYSVAGTAVALVKNDQVIYTKGYGVRNVETKDPVTDNTIFAIGSLTKSFTALAVMQLVEQGKLDLDAPVIKYVPDLKLADPDLTKNLTLRQLLSHSSGLPRADELWYQTPPQSRKQVIADMATIKPMAKPDQVFQYCNQNFVLAAYALEQVTGQTWEEYVRQHIFDPLGMKSADFNVVDMQTSKDYSLGYLPDVLKDYQAVPLDKAVFKAVVPLGPAGSINANVADMAQWVRLQLSGGTVSDKSIISAKSLALMHTQHIALAGSTEGDALAAFSPEGNLGYGLAWFTGRFHEAEMANHGGEIDGFTADVTLVPSEKIGLVILTNVNGATPFTEAVRLQLTDWQLGLKPEPDLVTRINRVMHYDPAEFKANVAAAKAYKSDPKELETLVGDYTGVAGNFTIALKDGMLDINLLGKIAQDLPLVQFKPDSFLVNGSLGAVVKLTVDDQGNVKVFLGTTEIGERSRTNSSVNEYKDPKGRFTTTIPDGLTLEQNGDLAVLTSKDPKAVFFLGTLDTGKNDLDASAAGALKQIGITPDLKPINKRDVPVNSLTWTQFLYQLPGGDLLALEATQQGNTVYFIAVQAQQSAIQSLVGRLNTLLLTFKFAA